MVFRTMSRMDCSSSKAGTSARHTPTGAGCPDSSLVWAVSRRGSVSLDIPFHRSVSRTSAHSTVIESVRDATRLLRSHSRTAERHSHDAAILRKAERLIESCKACNENDAQIPFDNILDRVTGSDPSVTDYILEAPAQCPNCRREIREKTLIEPT